jgi:hypothetical protein
MDESWLFHYDSETKQQSMEWRHSGSHLTPPPNLRVQKSAGKVLASPRLFGIKTACSSLIISKALNYQRRVLPISTGAIEWLLKEKRLGNFTKSDLFLHDNEPAHRTLATQKKLIYLGFQCFDHPPYSPDLAPSKYHLFLDWKNSWNVAIFLSTSRSLLPRRPWWTYNILILLEWFAKVRATG